MSDVAHIAMQLEIGAARSAAWISAVPWIFELRCVQARPGCRFAPSGLRLLRHALHPFVMPGLVVPGMHVFDAPGNQACTVRTSPAMMVLTGWGNTVNRQRSDQRKLP